MYLLIYVELTEQMFETTDNIKLVFNLTVKQLKNHFDIVDFI